MTLEPKIGHDGHGLTTEQLRARTTRQIAETNGHGPGKVCLCVGEREEAPAEPNRDCPIHGDRS
jgi:hypothetical protein